MVPRTIPLIFLGLIAAIGIAHADGRSELYTCYDALNNGDNAGAIAACDRAIAAGDLSDSDLAVAYTRRSIADRNLQRYDDALTDCTKAVAHRSDDWWAHFACGNAHGSKGDYPAALKSFDEAIKQGPGHADAYNGRGNIHNQMGDFTAALADFDAALRLTPDHEWALISRGVALYSLSRFADAAAAFGEANSADMTNAYAVLWLALARSRAGQDVHMMLVSAAMTVDLDVWPGPIVKDYQLALAPLAPILPPTRSPVDLEPTQQQKCEADFYYAELDLITGKSDGVTERLQQAADTCPKTYIEHAAALAELQRIEGPETQGPEIQGPE